MKSEWILVVHAASTFFMTGLIWFVQVVHYPLMSRVGEGYFAEYENRHTRFTTRVVAAPMLVELISGLLLLQWQPIAVPPIIPWLGFLALGLIWVSTWRLQVPMHRKLAAGFDAGAHRRLVSTNWLRTALWSLRSLLVLAMIAATMR